MIYRNTFRYLHVNQAQLFIAMQARYPSKAPSQVHIQIKKYILRSALEPSIRIGGRISNGICITCTWNDTDMRFLLTMDWTVLLEVPTTLLELLCCGTWHCMQMGRPNYLERAHVSLAADQWSL
jgi:hypothetical protein